MTDEQLSCFFIEAMEILAKETDEEGEEIMNFINGFCWDEEDDSM